MNWKNIILQSLIISLVWLLCMVTRSYILFVVFSVGIYAVFSQKISLAWSSWTILTMAATLNRHIVPKSGILIALLLKCGPLLIALAIIWGIRSRRREKLPLDLLLLYLFLQIASSINGLVPPISFLKLFQFFVFFLGLWLGTSTLAGKPEELNNLRDFFFSLILVLVVGSILAYPFPVISYSSTLREAVYEGAEYAQYRYEVMRQSGALMLFSGITDHSQTLGPFLSIMIIYVLSDMIFIIKKANWFHMTMILVMMLMLFMSRARAGLFAISVSGFILITYIFRKVDIPSKLRQKLHFMLFLCGLLMLIIFTIMEIRSQTLTKWIRKTNDIQADNRSLNVAITETRLSSIENCMYEFRQNRLLGIGFQVSEQVKYMYEHSSGLMLTAPIEKGLLPLMVLGEGGIIGMILFYIFVFGFIASCIKEKYFVSLILFVDFFCSNIGEANFFSPGGPGGVMWAFFVLGGFSMDQQIKLMNHGLLPRFYVDEVSV